MKIYFAGYHTSKEVLEITGDYGVLTSYVEAKKKGIDNLKQPIILDSGAFSIASGKSKHTLDDYIKFLHKNKNKVEWYANLDIIGNPKATYDNQKEMEKQGLKPIPTFHYGSDFKWLKKYKEEYDFVGLGGLVPYAKQKNKLFKHLSKCFNIVRSDIKTHGWGMFGRETLETYPFYSVDSTSWLYGGKMRKKVDFLKKNKDGDWRKGEPSFARVMEYHELNIHNAKEYLKLNNYITKLWEKKGIKWDS